MHTFAHRMLAVLVLSLTLSACRVTLTPSTTTPNSTAPVSVITPLVTAPPPDTGWQMAAAGLAVRQLAVRNTQGLADRLWLVRLDSALQANLAVRYAPATPKRVAAWGQAEGARFAINAGYFTEAYQATGLLVSDGVAFGTSFEGFGGMLAVQNGTAHVRWLRDEPVWAGEPFEQAVQGWPMLLSQKIPTYTDVDTQVAPRTAVGHDSAGRLVFVVSPGPFFTLHDLGTWLAASDLDLVAAVNLDGGQSTGIWFAPELGLGQHNSLTEVPAVLILR